MSVNGGHHDIAELDFCTAGHAEHDPKWSLDKYPGNSSRGHVCIACIMSLLEAEDELTVKKKPVLRQLVRMMSSGHDKLVEMLMWDFRVAVHICLSLLGKYALHDYFHHLQNIEKNLYLNIFYYFILILYKMIFSDRFAQWCSIQVSTIDIIFQVKISLRHHTCTILYMNTLLSKCVQYSLRLQCKCTYCYKITEFQKCCQQLMNLLCP